MDILPIQDVDIPAGIMLDHTDLTPRNIFLDTQSGENYGRLGLGAGRECASGNRMADVCLPLGSSG